MSYVAQRLSAGLGIKIEDVKQILWPSQVPGSLGRYETAPLYIVVNRQGNIFSSSPFMENLFKFLIPITPWQENALRYSSKAVKVIEEQTLDLRLDYCLSTH